MSHHTFALNSESRAAKGIVPLLLRNMYPEPQPEGSGKRTPFMLRTTPGMTARVTPSSGKLMRGAFCQPGVVGGALFVVMGDTLYSIDTNWAATALGAIAGSGRVKMHWLDANLYILSSGTLYKWDGATLTANSDPDFPANAVNLIACGGRLVTNEQGSDTKDWSAVGDGLDWPATAFAASARNPDAIVSMMELGGDEWDFGATSTQIWRAQGGADEDAFDTLGTGVINRGIAGIDAIAKLDAGAMLVGDDRVVYEVAGYSLQRVTNRDVEDALAALSEGEAAGIRCFSFANGSHLTWAMRLPTGRAFFFDLLMRRWYERTCLGEDAFSVTHYARFNGIDVVGSDTSDKVYTWNDTIYADDSQRIERVAMLQLMSNSRETVSSLTFDMKTFGQPLSGQGSAPKAMVTFYRDGGTRDSLQQIGVERIMELGPAGSEKRPSLWRLGRIGLVDGLIIKLRTTDPIGFTLNGVYVNEIPS